MQNLNFTPKLLRQRRFLSFLLPLFALFMGVNAQTAKAGIIISNPSVIISRNGGANETFTATQFDQLRLGTYDINTGQLLLNGGSFTATATSTTTLNGGFIDYAVTDSLGNAITNGSITLTGTPTTGSPRSFTYSTAGVNLILPITNAGSGYNISLTYRATGRTGTSNTTVIDNNGGTGYSGLYNVTGTRAPATSIGPLTNPAGTIFIGTPDSTVTSSTYTANTGQPNSFQGANLGTFNINTGRLFLNGGTATTNESNGDVIQAARLNYRVFKSGQAPGPFMALTLTQTSYNPTTGVREFSLSNQQINLITNLANSGTGIFNIAVNYEADVKRGNTFFTLFDNNGGASYTAQFKTNGVPIQTDTWTGTLDDDWFNPGNWSLKRIPDAMTNVVIPNFATGDPTPYPNIYSDQSFLNSPNPNIGGPRTIVSRVGSGPALSRNLTLLGASSTVDRSILRLQANSTIKIYGDFSNQFLSYITRDNSNTWFASNSPQLIAQASYATLTVSGIGRKAVTGIAAVGEQFVFNPIDGNTIVTTDSNNPGGSYVQLADRLSVNNNQGAQLVGETDNSYILGLVQTRRANVMANEGSPRTLGGIGFTFEFTGTDNPGDVEVTRSNVLNYFLSSTRLSVRRVFGIRPSNLGTPGVNLRANVTFSVLPNETMNLRPNNGSIAEQDLVLFLSKNNGGTFRNLGRDGAVVNYTVTKNQVDDFATFTLGDKQNPLPVRLTAFDAKRLGSDALVTWQTASEQNSKGYEVQVSTNGKEFRTLSFVASATPNSTGRTDYNFVDKEANKTGQRYYRLHQVDLDGKDAYFGPAIVSFDGKAVASSSSLVAYPNPIKGGEELHLAVQSKTSGMGQVSITDMTGRTIRQESVSLNSGISDISISQFNELKSGMYIIRVALPSGENQTLKVVKQ